MDGLLWPSVCLLYLANTFFFFFLKKTDESSGSVKDPFFYSCSPISPITPGFRQTINVLDTVAFNVFFIYLFTVTASINFYAYFCGFLAEAPFVTM